MASKRSKDDGAPAGKGPASARRKARSGGNPPAGPASCGSSDFGSSIIDSSHALTKTTPLKNAPRGMQPRSGASYLPDWPQGESTEEDNTVVAKWGNSLSDVLEEVNSAPGYDAAKGQRTIKIWIAAHKNESPGARNCGGMKAEVKDGVLLVAKPFCRSWRCETCSKWNNWATATRIEQSLNRYGGVRKFHYSVLTFKPSSKPIATQYSDICRAFQKLRQRLEKYFGQKITYVLTVESHMKKSPHLNVLWSWPASEQWSPAQASRFKNAWLKPNLVATGFGYICSFERVRNSFAISHYLAGAESAVGKEGKSAEVIAKEFAKKSQLPVHAQAGFRRLRSSRGFLVPKFWYKKSGEDKVTVAVKFPQRRRPTDDDVDLLAVMEGRKSS